MSSRLRRIGSGWSEDRLEAFASGLARRWSSTMTHRETRVVGLIGELGAGKTTFVRAFVTALPGGDAAEVASPTYALVHEYETIPPVRHLDLYRLSGLPEVEELGPEIFEAPGIVLVEWFDRMRQVSGSNRLELRLDIEGPDRRSVFALGTGQATTWMEQTE